MTQSSSAPTQASSDLQQTRKNQEKGLWSRKLVQIILTLVVIVLAGLVTYLVVRLYSMGKQIQTLEISATTASNQLNNLNKILGKALDTDRVDTSQSSITLEKSLVVLKKVSDLLERVDALEIRPDEISRSPPVKTPKPKINSVLPKAELPNSEMFWWSIASQKVLSPLKEYFTDLVKIQIIDTPEIHQLAIDQVSQKLLKEELKMRLLTARQMLLNGWLKEASLELQIISNLVTKEFSAQNNNVIEYLQALSDARNEIQSIQASTLSKSPNKAGVNK
ncbi:MAG: hypothetical protein WCK52_03715 [Betaproteobacteria bacterium]